MTSGANRALSRIPLGRFGSVEEMAGVALFLASPPLHLHLRAETLIVDGGPHADLIPCPAPSPHFPKGPIAWISNISDKVQATAGANSPISWTPMSIRSRRNGIISTMIPPISVAALAGHRDDQGQGEGSGPVEPVPAA
ncbi:hypothetical protein [Sphingobium yanoikuyae]|uniref:hypothetical protein n=1 Tax=Sphingobium yanoikuyae TaxID=13690 RepID=UPI003F692179